MDDKIISRQTPTQPSDDEALVKDLSEQVQSWERRWEYAFKRMRLDRRFARGAQWNAGEAQPDGNYTANVTLRHLKQRTAAVYARNPSYSFRRRERLWHLLWDGLPETLQEAQARVAVTQQAMQGMMDPMMLAQVGGAATEQDMALLEEVAIVKGEKQRLDRLGDTTRLLMEYFAGEQNRPFKTQMKRMVQRAHTIGCAFVRPGYQRVMGRSAETEQALKDERRQLEIIERLSADIADGEVEPDTADAARLRHMIAQLEAKQDILIREGLTFEYPDPTCIIPDLGLVSLLDFEGCAAVAEKHLLLPSRVEEVYGVDIGKEFTAHKDKRAYPGQGMDAKKDLAAVYEIWNRDENLIYTICDGYPAFLLPPAAPETFLERFFPWFTYAPNWTDDDEDPYPPSDVALIRDMQQEINRAGEALRDHRYAARPGWVSTIAMSDDTKRKIESREAHQITDIDELQGKRVDEVFQPFPASPIDPNLYATGPAFDDIMRVVGSQEANFGGNSGGTATEVSIAESSRQSALTSSRDELDDLLTHLTRACGQIFIMEMSEVTVKEIVGPAAEWPEQAERLAVAKEVLLEVEAGSTGRPNQAQQIQTRERLLPLLMQMPGINPITLVKDTVRAMDDNIDMDQWVLEGAPSITAINGQAAAAVQAGPDDPSQQGGQGASNSPRPPDRRSGGMPRNEQGG